jgi:hypothetical protein
MKKYLAITLMDGEVHTPITKGFSPNDQLILVVNNLDYYEITKTPIHEDEKAVDELLERLNPTQPQ